MCNRYALSKKQERLIIEDYGTLELYFEERFNIAPTQSAPVVLVENSKLVYHDMKWGYATKWSKAPVLNAKFETLADKPTFRDAFENHRSLIPASSFYEWQDFAGRKQPVKFLLPDERLFFFAGLYSTTSSEHNFVIITVPANEHARNIHDRMPLILSSNDYRPWLDPASNKYKSVLPTIEPFKTYWVSDRLNNSRNTDPEAAQPLIATVRTMPGSYPLPAGLPDNATVKIHAFDHGHYDVEYQGRAFKVSPGSISFKGETANLL